MCITMSFLLMASLSAQSSIPFCKLKAVDISFAYNGWDIQKESDYTDRISQYLVPISLDLYLGRHGVLSASTASASSSYSPFEFNSFRLTGPSDIKLQSSWYVLENYLLLSGGLNIPTGISTLNDEQVLVASILAIDELNFPLALYGTGWEGNAGVFLSHHMFGVTAGVGASGYIRGKFKLYEQEDMLFQPSNELNVGIGLDKSLQEHSLSIDYFYTMPEKDRLDGQNAFKPGNKSLLDIGYIFQSYPIRFAALVRNRWKEPNTFLLDPTEYPIFNEETSNSPYQLEIFFNVRHQVSKNLGMRYSVQSMFFREDETGNNEAYIWSIGLGTIVRLRRNFYWVTSAAGFSGYTVKELQRLDLLGLQLKSGVNYRF